jgi:hypothetical protein
VPNFDEHLGEVMGADTAKGWDDKILGSSETPEASRSTRLVVCIRR